MSVKVGDEGRILFHVIISIANNKGGTGKTTTAVNLGTALAAAGRQVLLVDMDPQGSATVSFGFEKSKLLYTIYDVLAQSRKIEAAMLETKVEHLTVVGEDRFRFHSPSDDVRWANRSSQEDSERVERKVRRPCCQERNSQIRPDGRSPEQRNPGNHLQPNKQGIVRVPEASQGYAGELSGGYGPHQARLLGSPRARWNQHLVEYAETFRYSPRKKRTGLIRKGSGGLVARGVKLRQATVSAVALWLVLCTVPMPGSLDDRVFQAVLCSVPLPF